MLRRTIGLLLLAWFATRGGGACFRLGPDSSPSTSAKARPAAALTTNSSDAKPPRDHDTLSDFRSLLSRLVAADTTNPPGNEARAVAIIASRLDREKIPYEVTEFAPGRQNLVARLAGDGSAKPLLLIAHLDVVGAEGQPWSSPPHEVVERDGFLVGRGVSDDLGMALLELETVVLLKRSATQLRRDVILALTGDE